MSSAAAGRRYTPQEYLQLEHRAESRSEYLDGYVYAMAGASLSHVTITTNLVAALMSSLEGTPCRAYSNDMRVLVEETGLYTYPDLTVVCGERHFLEGPTATLLNPSLIVEILSPSTESYDRGKKFGHYRRIPSLREYVLIAQDEPRVECWIKQEPQWSRLLFNEVTSLDAIATFTSIDRMIPLRQIYDGVEFPAPAKDDLSR